MDQEIETTYETVFNEEPPAQPELNVVIQENLSLSDQAVHKSSSPPKEPSLDFLFQDPKEPTDGGTEKQSTTAQGKELIIRTDFHSPDQDEPIPPDMKLDDILHDISKLSHTVSQLKNDSLLNYFTIY